MGARIIQLEALGGALLRRDRSSFPSTTGWFEARPALWQSLCDALDMRLELAGDELARFRCVVERVADPRFEIALAKAKDIDDDFAVGDDVGVIVGPAHRVWRWLFDQAWEATRNAGVSASKRGMPRMDSQASLGR